MADQPTPSGTPSAPIDLGFLSLPWEVQDGLLEDAADREARRTLVEAGERALRGRCQTCLRPVATAPDRETNPHRAGTHVCWEPGECRNVVVGGVSVASIVVDALLAGPLVDRHRRARAGGIQHAARYVGDLPRKGLDRHQVEEDLERLARQVAAGTDPGSDRASAAAAAGSRGNEPRS